MNILVIGSGGREHALCWKLKQSPLVEALYCAPGNGGIAELAQCVTLEGHAAVIDFCKGQAIGLVVVGPEAPLVDGLADALRAAGIPVFGHSAKAAQLEGSKGFTKDICAKYDIPTAAYGRFADAQAAKEYVRKVGAPIVVKADGLAAGKGVLMCETLQQALDGIDTIFGGAFGAAGAEVVIEEWLHGEEVSLFALTDGKNVRYFGAAQDHKRVGEGDTGPNTGGMGSYAPPPVFTEALRDRAMREIVAPTVAAMAKEGMPCQGVLFAGLMLTENGPSLIEYNVRFGDPECQSLMLLLESDIAPLLLACATGEGLMDAPLAFRSGATMCVVMAASGYPGDYRKGNEIRGLEAAGAVDGVTVFHAGTAQKDGKVIATGGRVLGVTAYGGSIAQAKERAYAAVDRIDWPKGFCRRDIGWRAL